MKWAYKAKGHHGKGALEAISPAQLRSKILQVTLSQASNQELGKQGKERDFLDLGGVLQSRTDVRSTRRRKGSHTPEDEPRQLTAHCLSVPTEYTTDA